jgi:DNA-binding response OmpR family regulator
MNVLLVDDDDGIRLIAGFVLRQAGHVVDEAADGASALVACATRPPDLLLMDVQLGEEDGVVVARELLHACQSAPRLVFLTGTSRAEQLERLRAEAPAGIVQKPFDPATLAATVAACLEGP